MDLTQATIPKKKAAQIADVSEKTISRWIAQGRLAARRKGNRIFTSREALEAACPHVGPAEVRPSDAECRRIMEECTR